MYAVCGATGNIGRVITEKLLAKGEKVRAIGRSKDRLQPLVDKGAEPVVADLKDQAALTKAFEGCRAVYAMIPPNFQAEDFRVHENEVGKSIAGAIRDAGVKNVVNLSSVGADRSEGVGVILGLHDQEQRLNKLDEVNVIHLRPSFFMENHLWQADAIKQHGVMASPQEPDKKVPQIATVDIAEFAVKRMTALDFEGKVVRELLGPDDYSMNEVAAVIGRQIGKDDLRYQKISYDDARNHFLGMGASESVADGMVDLYKAFNEGRLEPTQGRSPDTTTPTTAEQFSDLFARMFRME